jgi:hypothetical protein
VRQPSSVSEKHIAVSRREEGGFRVFDRHYQPGEQFPDHLTFALRHENIDLLILKRAFEAVPKAALEAHVRATPTGECTRRTWFFYELLTGQTLDVEDAPNATAVDALDAKVYFTGKAQISRRHNVLIEDKRFIFPGCDRMAYSLVNAIASVIPCQNLLAPGRRTRSTCVQVCWPRITACGMTGPIPSCRRRRRPLA